MFFFLDISEELVENLLILYLILPKRYKIHDNRYILVQIKFEVFYEHSSDRNNIVSLLRTRSQGLSPVIRFLHNC